MFHSPYPRPKTASDQAHRSRNALALFLTLVAIILALSGFASANGSLEWFGFPIVSHPG